MTKKIMTELDKSILATLLYFSTDAAALRAKTAIKTCLVEAEKVARCEYLDFLQKIKQKYPEIAAAANNLVNFIIYRQWNFADVDNWVQEVLPVKVLSTIHPNSSRVSIRHLSSDLIYHALDSWVLSDSSFYWNDIKAHVSTYLFNTYIATPFGKTLLDNKRFVSQLSTDEIDQILHPGQASSVKTSGSGGTVPSASASSSGQPKNAFKSSGGQSANARDFKGVSGNKLMPSKLYKIVDSTKTNNGTGKELRAFIKPLSPKGAANGTNKIFYGSSAGYDDMTIYFEDIAEAQTLADVLKQKNITLNINGKSIPVNPQVIKAKIDSNGYYEIGTTGGNCLIAARKLNEEIPPIEESISKDSQDDYAPLTEEESVAINTYTKILMRY